MGTTAALYRGMRNAIILVLVATNAMAFELKKDRDGDVVRWAGSVRFVVDAHLDDALTAPGALEAVKAGLATWASAMPNVDLEVEVGNTATARSTITVIDHDWPYDDGVMAVTLLKVDYANNRIVEADIVFNAAQNRFKVLPADSKRGGPFADVQNTITHELGHAIGLQHEDEASDAVMFPMAYAGEVSKRALSSDEIAGLDALYPLTGEAAPAVGCSASGAVTPALLLALGMLVSRARSGRTAPAPGRA